MELTEDLVIHPLQVCIMGTSYHPITNWPQYNKSLINRGSLTFWVDTDAMHNYFHQDHHGRRDRSQLYSDQSICTLDAQGEFQPHSAGHSGNTLLLIRVDECAAVSVGL